MIPSEDFEVARLTRQEVIERIARALEKEFGMLWEEACYEADVALAALEALAQERGVFRAKGTS